jgi:hypothetical protein
MLLTVNISKAVYEFEWILKILESSENEKHMDCTLKCFYLWEKKYSEPKGTLTENKVIERLKGNFWALFKNKNTNVKPSFV